MVRLLFHNRIYNENFTSPFENGTLEGHVDLARLERGKVGGTFWSVFVECPKDGMDFSDTNYAASKLDPPSPWFHLQCLTLYS